jgi:hypothetical protein
VRFKLGCDSAVRAMHSSDLTRSASVAMCQRVKRTVKCVVIAVVMIYVKSAGAGKTETALVVREGRAGFLLSR